MEFSGLKKFNAAVMRAFELFIAAIGTMLVVVVVGNVLCRYVFHTTIPWAEELARFTFIWVTFIGSVLANDKNEHMQLDFIVHALPKGIGKVCRLIAFLIVIVLLGFLIRGGIEYTITQWDWRSSALEVRHGLVYMVAPICLTILALQFLARFVSGLIHFNDKEEEGGAAC